jgi:hypothetical protein
MGTGVTLRHRETCSKLRPVISAPKEETMPTNTTLDRMFSEAVESKQMPGIVAVAATDSGPLYEGAFGKRELGKDASMTIGHGGVDRLDDQGHHGRRGDAARRARQAQSRKAGERRGR